MNGNYGADANRMLDQIIAARRSIRQFKDDIPPRTDIEQIIGAGILAPYAGLAGRQLSEVRRFAVLTKNTAAMTKAQELIRGQMQRNVGKLKLLTKIVPYLRRNAQAFVKVVENGAANGLPVFKTAPCFIVAGERKGFPPVEDQSLACVMENMWLKATALGLGFQLLSAVQTMAKNREFMELVGIPYGEFALDACVIGYPDQVPPTRTGIPVAQLTKWLEL